MNALRHTVEWVVSNQVNKIFKTLAIQEFNQFLGNFIIYNHNGFNDFNTKAKIEFNAIEGKHNRIEDFEIDIWYYKNQTKNEYIKLQTNRFNHFITNFIKNSVSWRNSLIKWGR